MLQDTQTILTGTVLERAVLYARVSGDDTRKEGRNLAGQLDMGRQYATGKGYNVVAELPEDDRGASGAEIDLPQLNQVRAMAARGEFDVLVVRELDRLSRNLAKQLIVEDELKRARVRIEYVLADYADNPEGQLSKHIKGVIAEYEREKIKERLVRGARLKIKSGKVLGNIEPPFGYKWANESKTAFAIDETQAPIVKHIFEWYVVDGLSMNRIKQRLEKMGIAPPGAGRRGNKLSTAGDKWYGATIGSMLRSKTYHGKWRYGRTKETVVNGRRKLRVLPDESCLTVDVPPIVSPELFEAAQARIDYNKVTARRKKKYDYLLSGHSYCQCGQRMFGHSNTSSGPLKLYYGCSSRVCKVKGAPCHSPFYRADEIEWQVWGWVKSLLLDEEQLKKELAEYQTEEAKRLAPVLSELDTIARLVAGIEAKRGKLIELFTGGVFTLDEVKEQKSAYDLQLAKLKERQAELETQLQQTLTAAQKLEIEEFAAQIRMGLLEADSAENFEVRRRIIELLHVRAVFGVNDEGQKIVDVKCALQPTGAQFAFSKPLHCVVQYNFTI